MTARTVIVVATAIAVGLAACSGDDDRAEGTLPPTEPTATTAPPTTESPTTPPTTLPPTTTIDIEALKAQIAADYQRSWQLPNELSQNPTLENLDERIAQISAPGSQDAMDLKEAIEGAVATGERTVPGDPVCSGSTSRASRSAERRLRK